MFTGSLKPVTWREERRMPRPLDTTLEKRLIDAARNLWRSGEERLTMRALARAANTHAPGIYSRFRNRQDIIRMLLAQFEEELVAFLTTAVSVEAATELYFEFAINHPKEYETLYTHRGGMPDKPAMCSLDDLGPVFRWVQDKLTEGLALEPSEATQLALTIWTLWHGTAILLIGRAALSPLADSVRNAADCGVKTLMQEARSRYSAEAENVDTIDVCYPV
jgi:AcrR family transcriptional regulator